MHPSVDGEDPGEIWFRQENSAKETRALMRLEREFNATLLFEHGGRQPTSSLWISRILLDRLFRERLALGWTVKAFAKHYRKEVMRSLVKIQDLEDLAEPPLGGLSALTSAGSGEVMKWSWMRLRKNWIRMRKMPRTAPVKPISTWDNWNSSLGSFVCFLIMHSTHTSSSFKRTQTEFKRMVCFEFCMLAVLYFPSKGKSDIMVFWAIVTGLVSGSYPGRFRHLCIV